MLFEDKPYLSIPISLLMGVGVLVALPAAMEVPLVAWLGTAALAVCGFSLALLLGSLTSPCPPGSEQKAKPKTRHDAPEEEGISCSHGWELLEAKFTARVDAERASPHADPGKRRR